MAHFEEAARIKPTYADAFYNMALAYERLGRPDEAIGAYSRTLALAPENPDALFNLAMLFAERGRPGEAESLLVMLLRIAPGYPGAVDQLRAIRQRSQ